MGAELIRIDELRLRIPGLTEAEARRLGEEITRRVAEELPAGGSPGRLSLVDLRLSIPAGVSKDQLAVRIAKEILNQLR